MTTATTTATDRAGGGPAPMLAPAGLPRRAVALAIDYALIAIASVAIAKGLDATRLGDEARRSASALLGFAAACLYFAALEGPGGGATLGKRLLGLRVTDEQGGPVRFARALGRTFAKLLSLAPFGVGFLMAAFSDQHRALHDLMAGTLVQRAGTVRAAGLGTATGRADRSARP